MTIFKTRNGTPIGRPGRTVDWKQRRADTAAIGDELERRLPALVPHDWRFELSQHDYPPRIHLDLWLAPDTRPKRMLVTSGKHQRVVMTAPELDQAAEIVAQAVRGLNARIWRYRDTTGYADPATAQYEIKPKG